MDLARSSLPPLSDAAGQPDADKGQPDDVDGAVHEEGAARSAGRGRHERRERLCTGGNCIRIGLPGKLIFSNRKGLQEVLFY